MTTRQLYEQQIDHNLSLQKKALLAEFDAAAGVAEPVKVDGRRRENRKPRKVKAADTNPLDIGGEGTATCGEN